MSLKVYAVDGRLVATLVNGERHMKGYQTVNWNGRDDRGRLSRAASISTGSGAKRCSRRR